MGGAFSNAWSTDTCIKNFSQKTCGGATGSPRHRLKDNITVTRCKEVSELYANVSGQAPTAGFRKYGNEYWVQ